MKKEFIKQNVGIDVSKDDFKVSFLCMQSDFHLVVCGSHTFANTAKGFKAFDNWVRQKAVKLPLTFTMEATGVYYESLAYYLYEQGCNVFVVLPNQSKKYGQSLGVKTKTDKIDARILAQMGLERSLRQWQPVSPVLLKLKLLTRERDSLIRERTAAANHLHAYTHQGKPHKASGVRVRKRIRLLDTQIKEIENEITEIAKRDEFLQKKLACLISIPGVGLLTAIIVVAETNGFAAINSIKQLTSFAGMDIQIKESGTWKGKSKISKKGNSHIRKALFMPTFAKIKWDASTGQYYERLKEKKGKGMIAVVAVQRKLLGLMYTLWKKEEMYCGAA